MNIDQIKRLVIVAMFSDEDLMDLLVLKGGNALDVVYSMTHRASVDLDFSIELEFPAEDLEIIKRKIQVALNRIFRPEGFEVFDANFEEKPRTISPAVRDFWGGYLFEFKLIEAEKFRSMSRIEELRRNSFVVGPDNKKKFRIDISKFEVCKDKKETELDGYTIYVYTPEMIVFEKLRAICQQMPEYREIVNSNTQSARARDFYDIYTILEHYEVDLESEDNRKLLFDIFAAKKVPLEFLGKVNEYREYHRQDFPAVEATTGRDPELKDFDFYFDYVLDKIEILKPFWKI